MARPIARFVLVLLLSLPVLDNIKAGEMSQLQELRKERKFAPTQMYTGPDTPEDGPQLIGIVNGAIDDVLSMTTPLVADVVRRRLQNLIGDVELFATEDREQAYTYAVRIWRAAGFKEESGLFPRQDDWVLSPPWLRPRN